MKCTHCQHELPPDARFCPRCGRSVSVTGAPSLTAPGGRLAAEGERRQLTVMFCDLVGSTALSQRLDAEVYSEVLQAYHSRAAEAIER